MSLGRHVQISSFPETFNYIHGSVDSWPKHFRLVCDLESSLGLGHVHIDRPSSIAIVPLQNRTSAGHSDHTNIISPEMGKKNKTKKSKCYVWAWLSVWFVCSVCVVRLCQTTDNTLQFKISIFNLTHTQKPHLYL